MLDMDLSFVEKSKDVEQANNGWALINSFNLFRAR